jgi:DNA ligase-1
MKTLPPLYKRSTTGKVSYWEIIVNNNTYYTISGYTDGKHFQSAPTICEPKNVGKKNETTGEEQALFEATSIWQKKVDLGAFTDINDVDEEIYFEPILCKDFKKEKDKINYKEKVFVQRKYDGIRCIIKKDGMWTRKGKKIISAPHIFNSLKILFKEDPNLILDGELFAEKEVCDFNNIISLVRKTKPTKEDIIESEKYIKYYIYDLPSCEEKYFDRGMVLENLCLPECCVLVQTYTVENEEQIKMFHAQFVEEGYEGSIIRLNGPYENFRSKYLLKYKDFLDQEYEILGVKEGIGKLQGKVGTLIFDGFESSVNGTHEYLEQLWKRKDKLIGKMATVKYFELTQSDGTKGGVPRFPKVIQIDRESYEG